MSLIVTDRLLDLGNCTLVLFVSQEKVPAKAGPTVLLFIQRVTIKQFAYAYIMLITVLVQAFVRWYMRMCTLNCRLSANAMFGITNLHIRALSPYVH